MRISLNLATRPFVEIRPLLARLRLAMLGLTLLAIGLIVGLNVLKAKADAATAQMDALKSQTADYQNRMMANERRMRQPENRAVLERAQFLNELFAKKSFSWTAVMMDLERVLPTGVQVTSIEPSITKEGDVNIRLRISGERERGVELIRNLEKSRRFLAPKLTNETLQSNQTSGGASISQLAGVPGGVQFDILSGYNPLSLDETRRAEAPQKKQGKSSAPKNPSTDHGARRPTSKPGIPGGAR
jgi:type IV pilus assembly protein PilN